MEFLNSISGVLAAVVIPIVVAVVGHAYTRAIREREIQGRLVEVAIGILKEVPDKKHHAIRRWAADVVDQFSGVPFPEDLIERVPLPVRLTAHEYRAAARRLKTEKRFEEAVEAYRSAFEMEPKNPEPLNFAAVILSRDLKRYDEADEMYNRALYVAPEYVSPIYNKACNEVRRKNYNCALQYLEEAIEKDSKYRELARRDTVFNTIVENNERDRLEELLR